MKKLLLTSSLGLFALSLGSAEAATVLGQRVDLSKGATAALRSTGVCVELSCNDVISAKIDNQTTYLGSSWHGAFTYLVDGRVAMVGWVGIALGESPLSPAPSQFNRLSQKVAGVPMPKTWWNATLRNYDQSVGLYPGRVPRTVTKTAIFDTKVDRWETIYIAQPAHEQRLRALINRKEPRNAQAVADRFVQDMRGPLSSQQGQCPAGEKPLMATSRLHAIWDSTEWPNPNSIDRYFLQRGMVQIGCCGAPSTYSLPGLSGSAVTIETRNRYSASAADLPNGCVGSY